MRICFVVPAVYQYFNPDIKTGRNPGGAEKQIFLLSRELAKRGFDVHCVVADFGQPTYVELIDGVRLHKTFSYRENKISALRKLLYAVKKIDADICVFRSADVGTAAGIILTKIFTGKKIVYMTAHDAECSFGGLVKMSGLVTAFAMGMAYRFADKITSQSKYQFEMFHKKRHIKPAGVIRNIIPIQHHEDMFFKKRESVLWVSRCEPWKRPELFIELAARNPQIKFVMVAPAMPDKIEYFKLIKESAGSVPNLTFSDYVGQNVIGRYYSDAMFLVNTSVFEGFSNTMMEAMNNGCPILSLDVNPDGFIDEYKTGFCCGGDPGTFDRRFAELSGDETLRGVLGENAINYIKNNHGVAENTDAFCRILTGV